MERVSDSLAPLLALGRSARHASARPRPSNESLAATSQAFRHYSASLYCAGAEEQRCPNGELAGTCNWFKEVGGVWAPVHARDMNKTNGPGAEARVNSRMPRDRWDPSRAGL